MAFRAGAIAIIFGCFASIANAHETWLSPSKFEAPIGSTVEFHLTSGLRFPQLDYAILADRIAETHWKQNEETRDFRPLSLGKDALLFSERFSEPGTVIAWVQLLPKEIELADDKVAEYFDEISAPAAVRQRWEQLKGREPWKESYTKCAKTRVAIGKIDNRASEKLPVRMALEIIPTGGPMIPRIGQNASFQLLENGRPFAGVALGLIVEGSDQRTFQITDEKGVATLHFKRAGRALLFAVHLWRDEEHQIWRSFFTTLTIQINP